MSMGKSDYPGLLQRLQPGRSVEVLNDRVAQVKRLNSSIADWLQERSRLEEQYAAGLRKLARKPIDDIDLGIFSVPWHSLTSAMETVAEAHASLSSRIDVEIESPLRDFATTNRDMQAMTTIQGNLVSMAKEIEKAQQRTEKLQGKGERAEANKVANASSDLDNARAQWDSQAPYVFESLQVLDETRVDQLRDLLTQLVTLEVDQVEKNRVAAEQSLNVLLNVETADEIKTFALKAMNGRPSVSASRANRASIVPQAFLSSSTASRVPSGSTLTPIRSASDENASQVSGSGTTEPQKKGPFKGLKRLGTVMSRRQSKQPQQLSTAESPDRRTKSSPFSRLGRNKDSYSLEPTQEEDEPSQRPHTPLRMGSDVLEPSESRNESFSASRGPQDDAPPGPRVNGSAETTSPPAPFPNGSHQNDLAGLDPPTPAQPTQPYPYQPAAPSQPANAAGLTYNTVPIIAEPSRDSEGFSVPSPHLDPISTAQAEAAEQPQPQFNVNIRHDPIQEEGGEAALATLAKGLQAPPTNSRRMGTVRGRRDARNSTIISPYGASDLTSSEASNATPPLAVRPEHTPGTAATAPVTNSSSPIAASVLETPPSGLVHSPSGAFHPTAPGAPPGDNQSIRSGRSLGSTVSHGGKHPELPDPGLNASIIETVSARFEKGQLTTSSLVGEVALAYNAVDSIPPPTHESIQLENFSSLDKVAPNPAFINPSAAEKEGEYSVNLANLVRAQIAFKYQLRYEDATTHIPLLVAPAFRIEANQAMVIVSYMLHPNFETHGRESIILSGVTIALTLEGARATACQSKPVGTFHREKNLIFWQLGDITLRPGAGPDKLLARFATESEATGGHVEGKWEISGAFGSGINVSQHMNDGADPFADDSAGGQVSAWKTVPTVRKLTSGSYIAKS